MNCFVCGEQLKFFCRIGNQEIYRCPNCGLGVTQNLVSQQGDYHRDETYSAELELFTNIFLKRVKIISQFKKTGMVLEIGASTGVMLELLKKQGFQVTGVEMSRVAAKIAEEKGLKIIIDKFENIKFKDSFDIIILNHTLEHLENPQEIIEKCFLILNKGGIIYIDVPNFGSWSAKQQKCSWPLLLPEEHLWHFTSQALTILLHKNKFQVIFKEQASGIFDLVDPLQELIFAITHLKKRFFTELITIVPSFVISKLQIGTDLMIIAKK
ncbi:MAG: class I SAM-dependent methyltransferase [Candidatus Daviesbacteria bacterium]|nr:class I SAM-dependent methyltransferase [Candidatus Daviesbacteria bacterium]